MLGTVLSDGNTAVNKVDGDVCSREADVQMGKTDSKYIR